MATYVFVILVMSLIVAAWFVVEIGQKAIADRIEYDDTYCQIDYLIRNYEVNLKNYKTIMNRITDLSRMKYKNRKKTEVLTLKFMRKFKVEA